MGVSWIITVPAAPAGQTMLPTGLASSVRVPAVRAAVLEMRASPPVLVSTNELGCAVRSLLLLFPAASAERAVPPESLAVKARAANIEKRADPAVKPVAPTEAFTLTARMRSLRFAVALRKEKTGAAAARPAAIAPEAPASRKPKSRRCRC